MNPTRFGIVGGGWRSLFFLRAAQALPDRFEVAGMTVRNEARGQELEEAWGVKTYRTLDELLRIADLRFVVVSVPRSVAPQIISTLAERAIPVLTETPPAPDLAGLLALHDLSRHGARIQVAEQYHLQPLHAARLAFTHSGKLGVVTQAQVSIAHGYHGISLIRRFLGITFEPARITAHRFTSPLIAGPERSGPPSQERLVQSEQHIAYLDFGDKLGVFDFVNDHQYRSWIRSPRLLVRGNHGEINATHASYLVDYHTPITLDFMRQDAGTNGNIEGYYHKGILAGSEWVYKNPFAPARLNDEEIAVASCLAGMDAYVDGGPDIYSLAEASQDHYLSLMIERSLPSSEPVVTALQPWVTKER
ncbi:MAG: Gfo/Idh/MocA family oxidoreductase [Ktedonobacteraceae bacterium]|nr:Gfo/Idh/MocA family oxidoreductase [Ktedonobacteraceae bacterium]